MPYSAFSTSHIQSCSPSSFGKLDPHWLLDRGMEERHADVVQRKLPTPPTRRQSRQHQLQSPHRRSARVVLWCATVGELPAHNPRQHCALVLSVASKKSPVGLWGGGHDGFLASFVVRRIPKVSNGKEASDVNHSGSGRGDDPS